MASYLLRVTIIALVALVAAVAPVRVAHAQKGACAAEDKCDEGQAWAACQVALSKLEETDASSKPLSNKLCKRNDSGTSETGVINLTATYGQYNVNGLFASFGYQSGCAARPNVYQGTDDDIFIAKSCDRGCEMTLQKTADYSIASPREKPTRGGRGMSKPTGNTCKVPDLPPKRKAPGQFCHETAGGHLVCKRDDGKTCVTSGTTGRTYCAADNASLNATNPNRTENVTIGPAGPTTNPPPATPPTPRPGENWKPAASATVTNNTNNTVNNVTVNGNAGTPNTNPGDGNSGDGSGNTGTPGKPGEAPNPDGGDGEGEGSKNTASGGSCASGWSTTGDAILGALLNEQNKQRCAGEKAGKGFDDMSGTSLDDSGVLAGIWKSPGVGPSLNRGLISVGGGGSLLPSIELEGRTWTVPESFYEAVAQIRFLIIAVCTIIAAFIVGRNI